MSSPKSDLHELERIRAEFGDSRGDDKRALLERLERRRLPGAKHVEQLHEILCFLRAYPDDARLLAVVERLLAAFARRADLRRHRDALVDTGIAGADIRFTFFQPTASWLARRCGKSLAIDWSEFEKEELLGRWLPLLTLYTESPGLDELPFETRRWIEELKGAKESDGEFLIRRFDALGVDAFAREKLYDELGVPMVLSPGAGTPTRTHARWQPAPVTFQTRSLHRPRPVLPGDILVPPRAVRAVPPKEGRVLIDMAREAMVTRSRDLDLFCWADERDVRVVDCGDGLQFACMGAIPERRLLLESVYAFLTLKNGVPIGYVLNSALFGSAEIAYNVFDTYRGGEAGYIYGRVLATVHALFGSTAFTIYPYQLGDGNEEAIESGAWWFYQKLGFRPRDEAALGIMDKELARMKRDAAHRSKPATLRALATQNVFFHMGPARDDVIGVLELPNIGLRATRYLAKRFGADREQAAAICGAEAAELLGAGPARGWTPGERQAWTRWAPLVHILPGVARWSAADRLALVEVMRAKGSRRETEFVARFDAHGPLRRAMRALARPIE